MAPGGVRDQRREADAEPRTAGDGATSRSKYFAYVLADKAAGRASGSWNGPYGASHVTRRQSTLRPAIRISPGMARARRGLIPFCTHQLQAIPECRRAASLGFQTNEALHLSRSLWQFVSVPVQNVDKHLYHLFF